MNRLRCLFKRNERGQTLVEFALVVPLLLGLLLAIIQFGVILSGIINVSTAVREGARIAIVKKDDAIVKAKVRNVIESAPFINPVNDTDIAISFPEGTNYETGEPVKVQANASVKIIIPIFGFLEGAFESIEDGNFNISSAAIMRVE